jgi:hypothetical protein
MASSDSKPDESVWQTYWPNLDKIPAKMSEMLENYSHIPPGPNQETQIAHVLAIRNPLYKSNPYPCMGRFRFLELDLATHALYKTDVLPRMTSAAKGPSVDQTAPIFLDLGTCFSQDMRKLIYDGAPASACYGADIIPAYIDAGYALFNDADRLPRSQFFCPVDIFDLDPDSNSLLKGLAGRVEIVHATGFFHLFGLAQQKVVAAQCLRLLRKDLPQGAPCLVLGKQVGTVDAHESMRRDDPKKSVYRHNEDSWREMWEDVTKEDEFKGLVKRIEVGVTAHERHSGLHGGGNREGKAIVPSGFRWLEYWVKVWF